MNYLIFFFKQKTAYEMRISDWSSDVCSSDLRAGRPDAASSVAPIAAAIGDSLRPCLGTPSAPRSEERRVGKSVSVRVDLGGRRIIKKTNIIIITTNKSTNKHIQTNNKN